MLLQAAAKEAKTLAGMVDSDDEGGDGDGFGANAAVRVAQPQVTVAIADNVSSSVTTMFKVAWHLPVFICPESVAQKT